MEDNRIERKRGVAVIMVLGVLSLLMVLAVSFSETMRIERKGAANYVFNIRSRQLLEASLSRAIDHINSTTTNYYPPGRFLTSSNGLGYTDWNVTNDSGTVSFDFSSFTDYVPDSVLSFVTNENNRAQWIQSAGDDAMPGVMAYMVLNVSDHIDINTFTNTDWGSHLQIMDEVFGNLGVNASALRNAVSNSAPFESLGEFKSLYPAISTRYLTVGSRYPDQTNTTFVGGDHDALVSISSDLISDISGIPIPGDFYDTGRIFVNLLDYVDTNNLPKNIEVPATPIGPYTEAVNMLNEIMPETLLVIKQPPNTLVLGPQFRAELWAPFYEAYQPLSVLRGEMGIRLFENGAEVASNSASLNEAPLTAIGSPQFHTNDLLRAITDFTVGSVTNQFDVDITLTDIEIVRDDDNTTLDTVPGPLSFATIFTIPTNFSGSSVLPNYTNSYQAYDPRFNWMDRGPYWYTNTHTTMGTTNSYPGRYIFRGMGATAQYDWDGLMYRSNRGRLYSPLEFGNLVLGHDRSLWTTFRVFNQSDAYSRHKLFENLRTGSEIRRGLINLNTDDDTLLDAMIEALPANYAANEGTLAPADVATLRDEILVNRPYSNITDVLDHNWRTNSLASVSDTKLEALAAYLTSMTGVRQNLFVILMQASSATAGMGTDADLALQSGVSEKAVAVVWRDSIPVNGHYETAVLFYKEL